MKSMIPIYQMRRLRFGKFKSVSKIWYVEGRDFGHYLEIHLFSIYVFPVPGETRMRFFLLELTLESDFDPELPGFGPPLLPTLLTRTGLGNSLCDHGAQSNVLILE